LPKAVCPFYYFKGLCRKGFSKIIE